MERLDKKDLLFVGIQLALFLAYIILPEYDLGMPLLQWVGGPLALFGLLILLLSMLQLNTNLSPFPSPKTHSQLVTKGVYRYMRHPIYTGIIFAAAGIGLVDQDLGKLLVSLALLVLFYFKSDYEEELLVKKFGAAYTKYQTQTRRFL